MTAVTNLLEHELTPKQQEAVDFKGEHMLIKGIAGSGKTTVLLRKALKIIQEEEGTTVGLFTYNSTLAEYASSLAEKIDPRRIQVYTFHSWALKQLYQMTKRRQNLIFSESEQSQLFRAALQIQAQVSDHRFFHQDKYQGYLMDEISWMKGKGLLTREAYRDIDRVGRGSKVRVTEADREKIFDLFESYQQVLKVNGKAEFDDLALNIMGNLPNFPETGRIDHILVDEAQDLQQVQLELLRIAAKQSMIVAADKGQKIYKTSFSWRDIGINIQGGRTKVLQNAFRSTRQIIQLAHSLQLHDPICKNKDEEYVEPVYPDVPGPTPKVIACKSDREEEQTLVQLIKELQQEDPGLTIGVLTRSWKEAFPLRKAIEQAKISCQVIKKKEGSVLTPGVKVTTLHSAKGLEFDVVFVCKVNEETIPAITKEEDEDEENIAVERRLLYVSMTRAKHELYMLYSGNRSRFFDEMDASLYELVVL